MHACRQVQEGWLYVLSMLHLLDLLHLHACMHPHQTVPAQASSPSIHARQQEAVLEAPKTHTHKGC